MAEKPKEGVRESDSGSLSVDKKESGNAQPPVESNNGANHEAEVTEVEKSPVPPANEAGESADEETTAEEGEAPAPNEEKGMESNTEDEREDEGAEGSKLYEC